MREDVTHVTSSLIGWDLATEVLHEICFMGPHYNGSRLYAQKSYTIFWRVNSIFVVKLYIYIADAFFIYLLANWGDNIQYFFVEEHRVSNVNCWGFGLVSLFSILCFPFMLMCAVRLVKYHTVLLSFVGSLPGLVFYMAEQGLDQWEKTLHV